MRSLFGCIVGLVCGLLAGGPAPAQTSTITSSITLSAHHSQAVRLTAGSSTAQVSVPFDQGSRALLLVQAFGQLSAATLNRPGSVPVSLMSITPNGAVVVSHDKGAGVSGYTLDIDAFLSVYSGGPCLL